MERMGRRSEDAVVMSFYQTAAKRASCEPARFGPPIPPEMKKPSADMDPPGRSLRNLQEFTRYRDHGQAVFATFRLPRHRIDLVKDPRLFFDIKGQSPSLHRFRHPRCKALSVDLLKFS